MNAIRHKTRILLRGVNQKKIFLLKKLSDLGPPAKQTDAIQARHTRSLVT